MKNYIFVKADFWPPRVLPPEYRCTTLRKKTYYHLLLTEYLHVCGSINIYIQVCARTWVKNDTHHTHDTTIFQIVWHSRKSFKIRHTRHFCFKKPHTLIYVLKNDTLVEDSCQLNSLLIWSMPNNLIFDNFTLNLIAIDLLSCQFNWMFKIII